MLLTMIENAYNNSIDKNNTNYHYFDQPVSYRGVNIFYHFKEKDIEKYKENTVERLYSGGLVKFLKTGMYIKGSWDSPEFIMYDGDSYHQFYKTRDINVFLLFFHKALFWHFIGEIACKNKCEREEALYINCLDFFKKLQECRVEKTEERALKKELYKNGITLEWKKNK